MGIVVLTSATSRVTILITHIRGLIAALFATPVPSSTVVLGANYALSAVSPTLQPQKLNPKGHIQGNHRKEPLVSRGSGFRVSGFRV